jgi:hypothetical protein
MSGFRIVGQGLSAGRGYGRVAASQVWDVGDPLRVVGGLLSSSGGAELLVADVVVGFALEPAEGIRAGSRPADSAAPLAAGFDGVAERSYALISDPGLVLATSNFWLADNPGTTTAIADTDIGVLYQLSSTVGGPWGIEKKAANTTMVNARIVDILNQNGLSQREFGGTRTELVFVIASWQ